MNAMPNMMPMQMMNSMPPMMAGMMPMPMMGGMPSMMPMQMPMQMSSGMSQMPMMGMGGMPMPGMMPMPMMMRMPMMCRMTCEMTREGMVCKMMPMDGQSMEMVQQCCDAMNAMLAMGAPCAMVCNGMPMMMGMMAAPAK